MCASPPFATASRVNLVRMGGFHASQNFSTRADIEPRTQVQIGNLFVLHFHSTRSCVLKLLFFVSENENKRFSGPVTDFLSRLNCALGFSRSHDESY